jgi:hypothetical protein
MSELAISSTSTDCEHQLNLDFRQKTVDSARLIGDQNLIRVADEVNLETRITTSRIETINKPYVGIRLGLAICLMAVVIAIYLCLAKSNLFASIKSWREVLEITSKIGQSLVVAPLLFSFIFIEGRLRRKKLLRALDELEHLNDEVYQIQFNHNICEVPDMALLQRYLTCCCGLLFLIREAAGRYATNVADPVVLERISSIRRGSNDNHRNILMKMQMTLAVQNSRNQ